MPDWKQLIRERMASTELGHDIGPEIVAELATHFEEIYEDACTKSPSEDAAIARTLQEVRDWHVLAKNIYHASYGEEQFMNNRTRSLWLPGLASMAAANLFLLMLTQASLQPQYLVRLNSGLGRSFYFAWLFAQVLFGALGAFLSRRAGGTRSARVVAGAFPAITMFMLCAVVIPISAIFEGNTYVFSHPAGIARGILICAAVPAIALLIGAAPFLRDAELRAA